MSNWPDRIAVINTLYPLAAAAVTDDPVARQRLIAYSTSTDAFWPINQDGDLEEALSCDDPSWARDEVFLAGEEIAQRMYDWLYNWRNHAPGTAIPKRPEFEHVSSTVLDACYAYSNVAIV